MSALSSRQPPAPVPSGRPCPPAGGEPGPAPAAAWGGGRARWGAVLAVLVAWLPLPLLLLRPARPDVAARLALLREAAGIDSETGAHAALVAAEAVADARGLLPLPAVDLPRLWVVGILVVGAAAGAVGAARSAGPGRWLRGGLGGLLGLGALHVWTNIFDLWDRVLAGEGLSGGGLDGGQVGGAAILADTKPVIGILLCLGLAVVVDRVGRDRRAAACVVGVAVVIAHMWGFSVGGELAGPVAASPLVALPVAAFGAVFDRCWPALAGAGPLLFDDAVLEGAMIELLVFTNVAAALFSLALWRLLPPAGVGPDGA